MVVTGDRDAFQLIDGAGLVKVMATSRGITETKIYDRQAVVDRYGIAPELIPDFYGLKGDTSDNIPGVPGIGDKTASELLQRFGTLEEVLAHVDEISGAKRKQNLVEHAEDARISKRLATMQRDIDGRLRRRAPRHAREPDRSRLREVFREYELRDPLRRLEEALGERRGRRARAGRPRCSCAARVREGARRRHRALAARRRGARSAVRRTEVPEGALFAAGRAVALRGRAPGGGEVLVGECAGPRRSSRRAGRARRSSRTTPRRCGAVPARASRTTRCSAPICSSRRGAATRSPSCARSAGWRDATSTTRSRPTRCWSAALADWQREQIERARPGAA